jgi:hypothetical protein
MADRSDTAAHSRAPWIASCGEIVADDGEIVGVVYRAEGWSSGGPVRTEDQANARLIATAPELLAALQAVVEAVQGGYYSHDAMKAAGVALLNAGVITHAE